jgi:hypothetical protein
LPVLLDPELARGAVIADTDRMKKAHSIIAACAGLAIALTGGLVAATWRTAEATSAEATFARPNTLNYARPAAADITRYGVLGDDKTRNKISSDLAACRSALKAAGVSFELVPAKHEGACGYGEALEVKASLAAFTPNPGAPEELPMTCDLAARLHMWERHVVIPAAEKYLGSPVVDIKAFGTFQCRTVAGLDRLSEHSFAKAADIAGFILADGREISVLEDYYGKGAKGDFLREIRQRACDLFDVTLGPDYNEDHANHFHLDVGGEHACR